MRFVHEVRRAARAAVVPVLCAAALGYFGYYAVVGERGLVARSRLEREIARVERELARTQAERLRLERRVALLGPAALDLDMLDERARIVLGFARPDELVIFAPPPETGGVPDRGRD